VSATSIATSTALDAAIPAISVSGAVTTARIASAAAQQPRARDAPDHPAVEDGLAEQEQRGPAERQQREAERDVVGRMGDRQLVADRDRDQREHDHRQRPVRPPADRDRKSTRLNSSH